MDPTDRNRAIGTPILNSSKVLFCQVQDLFRLDAMAPS
jgi:hypothetical protein